MRGFERLCMLLGMSNWAGYGYTCSDFESHDKKGFLFDGRVTDRSIGLQVRH